MKCDHCAHARPHKAGFKVCKHPRTLDFQRRLNGSDTGLHVEVCWKNFCRQIGMYEGRRR